jgi:hypothetical protein
MQFDDVTRRTVEMIDVLWLKGSAIVAAFEIESTTSIYSGLLRMSDLIDKAGPLVKYQPAIPRGFC